MISLVAQVSVAHEASDDDNSVDEEPKSCADRCLRHCTTAPRSTGLIGLVDPGPTFCKFACNLRNQNLHRFIYSSSTAAAIQMKAKARRALLIAALLIISLVAQSSLAAGEDCDEDDSGDCDKPKTCSDRVKLVMGMTLILVLLKKEGGFELL
ncbi:uncharacterized protein A4U43_C05F33320 [Asparagus officinalis]|uniref:Uncharacterized protein n=1 Tax=Asparagus officinalis TaxID=4686 RepID=A0A5P1F1U4_ASPOF|nr:uncharacterized protein A4U43_C05F33320 [Asparagus officinalis]